MVARPREAAGRVVLFTALYGSRYTAKRALWRIVRWYTRGRIVRVDAPLVRAAIRHYAQTHGVPIDEEALKQQMRRLMKILRL